EYIIEDSINLAESIPMVEVVVQPRASKHPEIRAFYNNGFQVTESVRNSAKDQIQKSISKLLGFAGYKERYWKSEVISYNKSVRGIWSPFHAAPFTFRKVPKRDEY
ncbi:hypothetical protein BB560_004464, partial [Smittium megazygosporum]